MSNFRFRMDGPIFEEGIPLHVALASLQDIQSIFDKTYLVITGTKRLSKYDRESFQLRTCSIKKGSLETDLQIIIESAQYAIPVVASFSPTDIWNYTKQGFEFLRFIYALAAQGKTPMYQANDNGTVNVFHGDNIHVYSGSVIQIGEKSLPHWRSLNHKLKENKIDGYGIGSIEQPEIDVRVPERDLFDNPTHIEKDSIEITCDIFDFNKRANSGKLTVTAGGPMEAQNLPFSVVGSQDRIEYIASMAKPAVRATVLREIEVNPFGEPKVVRLHILEVQP